jgi:predicted nucleotidyltransferase
VEQTELLKYASQSLQRLEIPHAVVGSYASSIWGEARFTQDIDIVVSLSAENVAQLCEAFPSPEFYLSQVAAREAVDRHSQFNVIHPTSGNKIDFMIAGNNPWSQAQLHRGRRMPIFADHEVNIAAPEDVILGKLVYYREGGSDKHLRDIVGILSVSGNLVDLVYTEDFARQLGVINTWDAILEKVEKH